MRAEPEWNALPASTPIGLRQVLKLCLQKESKRRARDIGDVGLAMRGAFGSGDEALPQTKANLGWLSMALLGVVALILWALRPSAPVGNSDAQPTRWSLALPEERHVRVSSRRPLALSPDGKRLAFVAEAGGKSRLYLRDFTQWEATPIETTDGAITPFFSPDGQWLIAGVVVAARERRRRELVLAGRGYALVPSVHRWERCRRLDALPRVGADGTAAAQWPFQRTGRGVLAGEQMLVVDVELGESFDPGQPRVMFEAQYDLSPISNQFYDVAPDGERFVMIQRVDNPPTEIRVVLNAIDEIRRRSAEE